MLFDNGMNAVVIILPGYGGKWKCPIETHPISVAHSLDPLPQLY